MKTRTYFSAMLAIALSAVVWCFNTRPFVARPHDSSGKRILGISVFSLSPKLNLDYGMIKEAGIGWVRLQFRFPFQDKVGGKLSDDFLKDLAEAKKVRGMGLRILGVTPMPGTKTYDAGDKQTLWRPHIPAWAGPVDSNSYYDTYEKACEELARQTKGIVDMWQIANEMDLSLFSGPLSLEQVERYLLAGARGLKAVNPQLKVDTNLGSDGQGFVKRGEPIYRATCTIPNSPFDYAGYDAYFGSSRPGGPQDWIPVIDNIYAITGKPVLVNEWGYSSLQGSGKPLPPNPGIWYVCQNQAWKLVWRKEHSPEEQAAFVEMGMKIFATYPHVVGAFFFSWIDNPVCPWCGTKGCPMECGWGLVDSDGKPKPAYFSFKKAAQEYW